MSPALCISKYFHPYSVASPSSPRTSSLIDIRHFRIRILKRTLRIYSADLVPICRVTIQKCRPWRSLSSLHYNIGNPFPISNLLGSNNISSLYSFSRTTRYNKGEKATARLEGKFIWHIIFCLSNPPRLDLSLPRTLESLRDKFDRVSTLFR